MKLEIQNADRTRQVKAELVDSESCRIQLKAASGDVRQIDVRLLSRTRNRWTLEIEGRIHDVMVSGRGEATLVDWNHRTWEMSVSDLRRRMLRRSAGGADDRAAVLKAQMPGKVIQVLVREGDAVEAGQGLAVIEAMKMQNELKSPKDGSVARCNVDVGEAVAAGQVLFEIE